MALSFEQLSLFHGRLGRNLCTLANEGKSGLLLSEIDHVPHAYTLVFVHDVRHIHVVRIAAVAIHLRDDFDIEMPAIEIGSGDSIAVFGKAPWREWSARMQLQSNGNRKLFVWNMIISGDFKVANDSLGTLFKVENDVDLGFAINDLGVHLDVFISPIAIQCLQVFDALPHQLLTHTPA